MADLLPTPDHWRFQDLTGLRYGRLLVRGYGGKRKTATLWVCECDCGAVRVCQASNLQAGKSRSCGCLSRDTTAERNTKHGKAGTIEWRLWASMINRARHPPGKGGDGVPVCREYEESFPVFLEDVGPRPSGRHRLGRLDETKGHERGNVRWMTREEQTREREGRQASLCPGCGRMKEDLFHRYCSTCRQGRREDKCAVQKGRRENGLCLACGMRPTGGRRKCEECYEKARVKHRATRRGRRARGVCLNCVRPAVTKNQNPICDICWFKQMAKHVFGGVERWGEVANLWRKQGGCCGYTGEPLVMGLTASIDHKIPVSRGGGNEPVNLHFVSLRVNQVKGDLTHDEFLALCRTICKRLGCSVLQE